MPLGFRIQREQRMNIPGLELPVTQHTSRALSNQAIRDWLRVAQGAMPPPPPQQAKTLAEVLWDQRFSNCMFLLYMSPYLCSYVMPFFGIDWNGDDGPSRMALAGRWNVWGFSKLLLGECEACVHQDRPHLGCVKITVAVCVRVVE